MLAAGLSMRNRPKAAEGDAVTGRDCDEPMVHKEGNDVMVVRVRELPNARGRSDGEVSQGRTHLAIVGYLLTVSNFELKFC